MEIKRFLGLSNTVAPERKKPGRLEVALDVDVDDSGALRTRLGMTQVSAVASHSLFANSEICVVVQGTDMKRMDASGTLAQLARLQYGGPVSYREHNGTVYFSNTVDTGRIVAGQVVEWGIRNPVNQPQAAAAPGELPPGRYLYAMTYVRSDGIESGSTVPALIDLPAGGGIQFSGAPSSSDPSVVGKALYLSGPNGTELYRLQVVSAATSSMDVRDLSRIVVGAVLHPDPVSPPPAGQIVEVHAGVAYSVAGDTAYASDQYNLDRFRLARRYLRLPGHITLFASVEDGLYAATEAGTWFLEGTDPEEMRARKVLGYGAIPGTAARFEAEELVPEDQRPGPSTPALVWTSPFGAIIGLSGGVVKNLTEENFSMPTAQRGAGTFRVSRGYSSYVVTLRGNGTAPSAY